MEKKKGYSMFERDKLDPADSMRIERKIYFEEQTADLSGLTALSLEQLQALREEYAAAEKSAFEALQEQATAWDEQAGKTLAIDKAIEYVRTPEVKHTANQWEATDYGKHISNRVYQMRYHISENTRYDREKEKSIPYSWTLSWSIYTNSPHNYGQAKIAGQERKVFADKAAMEKYLNGRIKAYAHLFTEISPSIPKEYAEQFKVNGQLLPGYSIEGEERTQTGQEAGKTDPAPAEQAAEQTTGQRKERDPMNEQFSILIDSRTRFETGKPGGAWLSIPTTTEQLHAAMRSVGITADNPQDFFINGFANTEKQPFDVPLSVIQGSTIDELNYLGKLLEMQSDEDRDKFTAAVTLGEHAGSVKDLINLAQNLDCYWIYPAVRSEADYGYYLIDELDELELPEEAKKYFKYEEYGQDAVQKDKGQFTDQGYIYNNGNTFSQWYNGRDNDIPKEYKVMSFPEPERPAPEKSDFEAAAEPVFEPRPVAPIILTSKNSTDKMKEITDRLEHGIMGVFENGRYTDYLQTLSKFHNYSFNNTVLIAMQGGTFVKGYQQWKKEFDRHVKPDEKSIKILAPSPYIVKREVEKIDPHTQKPIIGKDGKPVTETKEIQIPAFKIVSVFDVSQTEGKEIPGITDNELTGDVEQYRDFFTALERTSPFAMGFEALEGTVKGRCFYDGQRIAINEGMSELQNVKTAIHEIAHATLHNIDRDAPERPDRSTREVQAESIAYTVCQHYGLDTSDYSFNYIATWSSGRELAELKKSLATIRSTAAELINTIDGHLAEIRKEREAEKAQEAEKEPTPDLSAEPTVTILWSESSQLREGETIPLSRADTLFAVLDEASLDTPRYFKTRFQIDYVMNGKPDHYEGQQDFGDGDGSLIEHIEQHHTYYLNDKEWENYLLQHEGKEALEADKEQRAMLLNEFIPYLKLHCSLSEMERIAGGALLAGESLTPTETAYHTAMQAYVAECRGLINQGEYHLPPVPQLKDFDVELAAYKEHVKAEIAQEAADAGMTVEEYAANGYEPYTTPEPEEAQTTEPPEPGEPESQEKPPEPENPVSEKADMPEQAEPTTSEAAQTSTPEPTETTVTYYPINENAARHANTVNSFYDYKPGSATAEYRRYVDEAAEIAARQKKRVDPSFHERIDGLLDAYARKLAANMNKGYEIAGRVPSILIAGGSNFPVGKKEKQNAAADKNMEEYREIQGLLDKIRSTGMGGISADDPNAVSKLESKLAKLEQAQETMKAVNAYYRKHKTLDGCPHLSTEQIEKLKEAMSGSYRANPKPFESYQLSNNNAEIRRLKDRITALTRRKELGYVGWEFDGGRVEANTADNRLQIFFDEKPDKEIREELKGNGFRYAPSAEAWQRQLNDNAIYAADRIKCIQPLTGESPTELQKRARQEAAVQKEAAPEQPQEEAQGAEPGTTDTPEKPFEPESIYKVRQNPYSDSPENSSILQEYVTQDNGMAKLGDILYTGTPEKCRELLGKLEAGELTQGDVKELYAKAQEAQPAAEPGQETPEPTAAEKEPDKDTFSIYQLKRGDETRDYRFEPYDRLQAAGLSVEAANYDLIYTAPLAPDMTLEDISVRFNIDHPKDFKGHSLSTSDVVVLHQNGQDTAHYADSYGYREVPEFLQGQPPQLTPDTRMTGEQIRTPRGSFSVTDMTAEQMKEAGYGLHHTSEDGKYLIMGNGTQAFAVAAEQPEKANPLKHVEDAIEQNDNNFDGIINNTPTPTADELEAKARSGEQISLAEYAAALKAEKEQGKKAEPEKKPEKKPSIRAQLKADKERAAQKKQARSKSQDLERS
ncbi:DUF4316 domain-containing protein [Clostridiaceae bacterium]|nr:DUF4316 domain-containing protein [Clostridiaceae bacterium]